MLIIGSPIFRREWILPTWFEAIEQQDYELDKMGFIFEASPDDEETMECLFDWHSDHPEVSVFEVSINKQDTHQAHPDGHRIWNSPRYHTMVNLRNNLLDHVRCHEAEFYFSLDTDIILEDPQTITKLIAATENFDAVAPLAYMSPDSVLYPNYMTWRGRPGSKAFRATTYPLGQIFAVDIIMAAKLMTKEVYEVVSYSHHPQGEDLGWSVNSLSRGFKLGAVSNIYCAHVMHKSMLSGYKLNGDSRGKIYSSV